MNSSPNLSSISKFSSLLCLAFIALAAAALYGPNFVIVSRDLESFMSTVYSTVLQARAIERGDWVYWTSHLGLGMPQPFAQFLYFHPIQLALQVLSDKTALVLLYWSHLTVGGWFVFGSARTLGVRNHSALAGAFTWLLCSATVNYSIIDFWPSVMVGWTMLPPVFFFLLRLLDESDARTSLLNASLLALSASLLVLNGHSGVIVSYAVLFCITIACMKPSLGRIAWLCGVGVAVTLAVAFRFHHQFGEMSLFHAESYRTYVPFNLFTKENIWALLLKPLYPAGVEGLLTFNFVAGMRNIWIGPVFLALTVWSMFKADISRAHKRALAATFIGGLVLVHLPKSLCFGVIAWLIAFRDPAIVAGVLLASTGLNRLLAQGGRLKKVSLALVGVHFLLMIGGVAPFWLKNLSTTLIHYGRPSLANMAPGKHSIADVVEVSPLLLRLKELHAERPGRFLYTEGVGRRFPEALIHQGIWTNTIAYHDLPVLNGYFKGVHVPIHPEVKLMHSHVPPSSRDLVDNSPLLDALGVRWILALGSEVPPANARKVVQWPVEDMEDIVVYENEDAWSPAWFALPEVSAGSLPSVAECGHDRLLCADASGLPAIKTGNAWADFAAGGMDVRFAPTSEPRLLVITQMYRPGWRAEGLREGGERVPLTTGEALGILTAVEIPVDVVAVSLRYLPATPILLTRVSWGMLGLFSLVAVSCLALGRSRPKNDFTSRSR